MQRAGSICFYFGKKGRDDTVYWAKQREERKKNVPNDQQVNVLREKEDHDGLVTEIVAAVRQERDWEPPKRQTNLFENGYLRTTMRIENVVVSETQNRVFTGRHASKNKEKTSKNTNVSGARILSHSVEQYDIVDGIAQTDVGIIIGQLVRENASTTVTKAQKLLGGKIMPNLVAAIGESSD